MKKNVISILMIFVLLFGTVAPSFEKVSFANKSNENNIVYTDKKINSDVKKSLTDSSKHNEKDIEKTKKEVDIKTGIKANDTKSKEGKKTDSMSEKTLEKNKSENKKIEKDKKSKDNKSDTERNKLKEQTFITETRDIMRTPKEVDATIVEFKIVRDNNENPTGTFNFYEAFKIKIKWDASKHGKTLKKGDFFKIKIPEEFRLAHKVEFDLKTEDRKVLGHLVATPNTNGGADVVVTFNEYVETHENIKGEFSFDSAFNVSKYIKKSDGSYTISYTFDGKTYNHNIKPKPNVSNNEVFVKWANKTQDGLNEAEWVLRLNFKKGIFANVVISDELTSETGVLPLNIKYKPDTFRLKQVEFNSTGDDISGDKYKSIKYEELKNYITFDKDMRKFTFRMSDFLKDKGYSTDGKLNATQWYLFYKSTYEKGLKLKNKAEFKSKEETIERSSYYQSAEGNGSGGGDLTNKIKIKKVDSDNTDKPLANAKFKIIKKGDTSKVWNIVTDAKGEAETERLSQGDYEIIETDAPLGYMRDDKPIPVKIIDGQATITTIKNKKTKIEVKVTKAWEDKDNQDGKRPESITVKLFANGQPTNKTLTLTKENGWKGSFDNLDEYKDGKKIDYSIEEEDVGNGYAGFITQPSETEFKIINTRQTEKVNIAGEKTWEDKDNQDGKRPTKIKVKLLKQVENETPVVVETKEVEADATGKWTYSFENLDKYEKGKLIKYSIDEEEVTGYTKTVDGYNIKNSYTPEVVNIAGEKTWNDNDDQDGKRPESIKVTLYKTVNGVKSKVEEKDVTKANGWKYEFKNLPKYEKGKEIKYSIEEDSVAGYVGSLDGYNLTNTHTPEKVNIAGEKTWEDKDNQDGKRPTKIKVKLLKQVENETPIVVETKEVSKGTDGKWKYEFKDLPKYEKGKLIKYSIDEEEVTGYTKIVDGYNVKNSRTPSKTSIKVTKAWEDKNDQDGKRPTSVTIKLLADGVETGDKLTLTAVNGWKGSFDNLDEYKAGKKIQYSIEEEDVGNGYSGFIAQTSNTEFNVINKREPEKTFVEGVKTWDDKDNQDGKRPTEITINLLKNGTKIASKKVTEADGWKWKFENLDKYENGKEINYTITEEKVEGYTTEVKGYDVKNSYTPGKTSLQVTKAWEDKNDQDGVRPNSVTIKLLADGVETGKKLVLTKANSWTGSFTDLDEYKAGKKIVYTIKEETVGNGYISVVTKTGENTFIVTNTREPEKTFVEGTKTWNDKDNQDGKRPTEITINLLKNGTKIASKKVTKADGWKWKFENLDKYENGKEINYTITEEKVEGYTTEVKGYNVKNSYTPGKTSLQVTKAWEDKNDQDGVRPNSVTIKLLADGVETGKKLVLTKANNWTGSFTDLDEYKDGKKIVYTIKEETVGNGYISVVTKTGENTFIVINTRQTEKTFVEGTKTWNDKDNQDGKRPTEITINLLKNGTKIASKKVTKIDGWKWKFENLDKYENGKEINYTIAEEKVEGYTTEVKGYDVKNSYTPGKTSLQVTKAWEDKNDQDGVRPNSVTIKLLADGVETGKKLVLTKANNWTGSFTNLDEYKDGKKIVYTIKEEPVGNGYKSVITGNEKEGFVVTNVRTPEQRIPKTGVGSNSALYTVLLGLSGTVIFSVFRRKRKENL
ncbi:Cna B-type domain-containing protein [Parvimonas micra]|uniref:LPXTG-motif cell wall anchor domain protein n=1 Tax=Parvimonas micra ATCC 33270 TaxID=411465 RepID=A8SKC4_9FIRM|nr:Cna B-type domain-containing protein [Parvimonas micra]EDP24062.1 LPXTG-motif cell wall anchor domain protein [Parvimonas micra ATCC 33270]VEH96651.1 Collagen adhesin precursor [Parvimonas micra]